MTTEPNLSVKTNGLCKTFKGGWGRPDVPAVVDLNLDISRGEIFGLLGPNGSGKTTTIKMILGLLFPSSGKIEILGRGPQDIVAKKKIGFLPEESYFYRFLNADETLKFYGQLFGISRAKIREKTEQLLEQVGLKHARKRPIKEYSKGMARRIGLAAALVNDPELLILDEPTAGLDPIGTAEVKNLILQLKNQGVTILLCSHLLADVESVCDRIAIMYEGKVRVSGTVNDLLNLKDTLEVDVKAFPGDQEEALRKYIETLGGTVTKFGNVRTTLEELFLQTVHKHAGKE